MVTADQLVAHAVGDYILQSDWMANEKTKRSVAAAAHVLTYMLPFLFLTHSVPALATIVGTHFVIDRWRLARYVCWLKNWLAPVHKLQRYYTMNAAVPVTCVEEFEVRNMPWWQCSATGYWNERPVWLATWLLIITDNILHVLINALALRYL